MLSYSDIENLLQKNGWTKEVAGDYDFDLMVRAWLKSRESNRGLFICGSTGCGKTSFLKTMFKIRRYEVSRWLYLKSDNSIRLLKECSDFYLPSDLFLDDVGCEEVVKSFGNTYDVVGDFLQLYHERGTGNIYCTSNLGIYSPNEPTDITRKYGPRVADRILDMCVCVKMSGKSKRERIMMS